MRKLILVFAAIAITAGAYAQTDSKMSSSDMNNHQRQTVQNNPANQSHPDGIVMQNGKLMKIQNGQMTTLKENEMTMGNGTRIMSDGNFVKKDGTKMMLKEGEYMDMSGNVSIMRSNKDKNMYLVPDSTKNKIK